MKKTGEESASRDRVVEVATNFFVHSGYKSTSMKAIASQLGISPPALYWHFPSKQDLFLAAMAGLLDKFVHFVGAQVTASTPRDRLSQFVSAHVQWKLEQRDEAGTFTSSLGMRDIIHELPEGHRSILVERQRAHLGRLRDILKSGVASREFAIEDVNVTSFAIVTMCDYIVTWYDPDGPLSANEIRALYVNLAHAMVSGHEGGLAAAADPSS